MILSKKVDGSILLLNRQAGLSISRVGIVDNGGVKKVLWLRVCPGDKDRCPVWERKLENMCGVSNQKALPLSR